MIDRLAFFAKKEEFEEFFNFLTEKEAIFESHYNLAPAQEIPILISANEDKVKILRSRWGFNSSDQAETGNHNLTLDQTKEKLSDKNYLPCIIPVSGFYIWKMNDKKRQPFFVRMLNDPIMAIAGLAKKNNSNNKIQCSIIITQANALLQPLTEMMPLLFTSALVKTWLTKQEEQKKVLQQADKLFLLTEMTVHRVSKKVNDLSNNDSNLVQPIPK